VTASVSQIEVSGAAFVPMRLKAHVLQPGQMAGANPAVRPIVWTSGIIQFCPYLNG
jgi:hypothetical protein